MRLDGAMKTWLCKTGAPKIILVYESMNVYDHDFTVTFSLLKLVKLATKRGVPHFEPETNMKNWKPKRQGERQQVLARAGRSQP